MKKLKAVWQSRIWIDLQKEYDAIYNARIDNLRFMLNRMWIVK